MLSIKVAKAMQDLLTAKAEEIARQTGCSQRASKLGGAGLVQTLVFGYLKDRLASCEDLAQTAATTGHPVSPQAIDQRCTQATARCLQRLVEEAVKVVIAAEENLAPLLHRFTAVCPQDSSTVGLPDALEEYWRGCDTSTGYGGRSALKIQLRFDLVRGGILALRLENGRDNDHRTPLQTENIQAGSLQLRDLGYFELEVLHQIAEKKAYFLTRLQDGTAVFRSHGQRIELAKYLKKQKGRVVDEPVTLGINDRLPCRFVAIRVPPEVARRRRRQLWERARKKQYTPSADKLYLCDWNFYVTNVPEELLSIPEVLALARMRWQIELIFKLWKSHGGLGWTHSKKPWRILCEVFAKLLAQLIQHWILIRACWHCPQRSLRKAAKAVRAFAAPLAAQLKPLHALVEIIETITRTLIHVARVNKRHRYPSAHQLLADPITCGYDT
jgi:Transposase DDE domain